MGRKWVYRVNGRPGYKRKVSPRSGKPIWDRVLSANARPNVQKVAALRAIQTKQKQIDERNVMLACKNYRPETPLTAATLKVVLHWDRGGVRRDPGMAVEILKGSIDGLVTGGVLKDDSFQVIREFGVSIVETVKGKEDFYVMIIEEVLDASAQATRQRLPLIPQSAAIDDYMARL